MPVEEMLLQVPPPTLSEETDEGLMLRVMGGERSAFDELFRRFAPRLRSFVMRFVTQAEVAEDLVQEVFLKVYRNPKAFDPRGRFATWIFAVARNACIDWLRLKRLPTVPIGSTDDDSDRGMDPADPKAGPGSEVLLGELEERLDGALKGLSLKLREVFLLCAVQGLSYEEAADIVGCPVKTISSRLSRARDQVFRALDGEFGGGLQLAPRARNS